MTFDPNKPIKTTEGLSVRILCTDLKKPLFPIAAAVSIGEDYEVVEFFTAEGKYHDDDNCPHIFDLENV